jgi:hypothetical protein
MPAARAAQMELQETSSSAPPAPKAKPVTETQLREMAKRAIARRFPGTSERVTLTFTVTMSRACAEELAMKAIRQGRNLGDVVQTWLAEGA